MRESRKREGIRANWCENLGFSFDEDPNQSGEVGVGRPGSCCVALVVLKPEIQARLALNSQRLACPSLPRAEIKKRVLPHRGGVLLLRCCYLGDLFVCLDSISCVPLAIMALTLQTRMDSNSEI